MWRIIFFVMVLLWSFSFIQAGCFFRNIDDVEVFLSVEDQEKKCVLKNTTLKPNEEVFISHYYLRSVGAHALKLLYGAINKEKIHKLSFAIEYENNKNVFDLYDIDTYNPSDIDSLNTRAQKLRTLFPRKIIFQKPISGYFLRNIDDVDLQVSLHVYQKKIKDIHFLPNEEIFVDPSYLLHNQINMLRVSFKAFGKELSTVIFSPTKQYNYEKVYNILRHTNVFDTKHVKNEQQGTEFVAVRKQEGINFEAFYKRTGLYNQREKPKLILSNVAINQPNSAHSEDAL